MMSGERDCLLCWSEAWSYNSISSVPSAIRIRAFGILVFESYATVDHR